MNQQHKLRASGTNPEAPDRKSAVGEVDPAEMPVDAVAVRDDAPVTIGAMREIQQEMMQGMMSGMRGMMEDMMGKYVGGLELKSEVEIESIKESIETQQREIRAAASLASAAKEASVSIRAGVKKLTEKVRKLRQDNGSGFFGTL